MTTESYRSCTCFYNGRPSPHSSTPPIPAQLPPTGGHQLLDQLVDLLRLLALSAPLTEDDVRAHSAAARPTRRVAPLGHQTHLHADRHRVVVCRWEGSHGGTRFGGHQAPHKRSHQRARGAVGATEKWGVRSNGQSPKKKTPHAPNVQTHPNRYLLGVLQVVAVALCQSAVDRHLDPHYLVHQSAAWVAPRVAPRGHHREGASGTYSTVSFVGWDGCGGGCGVRVRAGGRTQSSSAVEL